MGHALIPTDLQVADLHVHLVTEASNRRLFAAQEDRSLVPALVREGVLLSEVAIYRRDDDNNLYEAHFPAEDGHPKFQRFVTFYAEHKAGWLARHGLSDPEEVMDDEATGAGGTGRMHAHHSDR